MRSGATGVEQLHSGLLNGNDVNLLMPDSELLEKQRAESELKKDWKRIRRSIGMGSNDNLLDAERMRKVINELASLSERKKNMRYSHYDMAHLFLLNHMLQALGNRIPSLGRNEKKIGLAILGKKHYNPPEGQYSERREAAYKLSKMGRRGDLIFSAIRKEYEKLDREKYSIGGVPEKFDDMFYNPIAGKRMELKEYYSHEGRRVVQIESIADFAKLLLMREAREKERKS